MDSVVELLGLVEESSLFAESAFPIQQISESIFDGGLYPCSGLRMSITKNAEALSSKDREEGHVWLNPRSHAAHSFGTRGTKKV